MSTTPYATIVCHHYNETKIRSQLTKANIELTLPEATTLSGARIPGIHIVTPNDVYNDNVLGFTQTMLFWRESGKDDRWVFDARPMMRQGRPGQRDRIVSGNDYRFEYQRAILTRHLYRHGSRDFERLGDVPVKTFVRWITLGLTQRFGLDPGTQQTVSGIVGYYYYGLLDSELTATVDNRVQLATRLTRQTGVDAQQLLTLADHVGPMTSGDDLAYNIAQKTDSLKLDKLTFKDIYLILCNSWIGINSRENAGVALEHLPTFYAMVLGGLDDRSYRKTLIARRAETAGRPADVKQFVEPMRKLIDDALTTG